MSWRRSGMLKLERVMINGPTKVPNLHLQVDLVGVADRTDSNGDVAPTLPKRRTRPARSISRSRPGSAL